MKKAILAAVLCLVLASLSYSLGFSLKLTGGAAYITTGDYNKGVQGTMDMVRDNYLNVTGEISKLGLGMDFGGEIIFNFAPTIGLGVGAGYMQFSHAKDTLEYDWQFWLFTFHDTETVEPKITAIPISMNLYFTLPMGAVNLNLFAGGTYYISSLKQNLTLRTTFLGLGTDYEFEADKNAFGFQGGLGLEFPISGNIAFVLDVLGRYARLSDITGSYKSTPYVLGIQGPTTTGDDSTFWYYEDQVGGTWYPQTSLGTAQPSGADKRNVRRGNFDFSGVSGRAGFKVSF